MERKFNGKRKTNLTWKLAENKNACRKGPKYNEASNELSLFVVLIRRLLEWFWMKKDRPDSFDNFFLLSETFLEVFLPLMEDFIIW